MPSQFSFIIYKAFSPFRSPIYTKLWIGAFISNIGTWIQKVAQPWVVLELTGSAFLVGLDGFMQDIPLFALLLIGGAVVDRIHKINVLLSSQIIQFLSSALLALLYFETTIAVWMVISISFIVGCMQAFSVPAYMSIITASVKPKYISSAIALNSTQFNLSRFLGPAVGGLILTWFGATWCFGLNALTFLFMFFVFLRIKPFIPTPAFHIKQIKLDEIFNDIKESFSHVFTKRDLSTALYLVLSVSFCGGSMLFFAPVIVRDMYPSTGTEFSLIISAFGFGAIFGAIRLSMLASTKTNLTQIIYSASGLAFGLIILSLNIPFPFAIMCFLFMGFCFVTCNATANSILQMSVPNSLRGRIASFYAFAFRGGLPFGSLSMGFFSEFASIQISLFIHGLILICCIAIIHYKFIFHTQSNQTLKQNTSNP